MISLIMTLALLGQPQPQQHAVYRFRTLPPAPGQYVPMQADSPPSPATDAVKDDPYGFTTWLNATRLLYGLGPLTYDPELAHWARRNNQAQRQRGEVGHFVLGPARRQNAEIITGEISPYLGWLWMSCDPQRAALLDPGITRFGLAWDGHDYWTWNAQ